MIRPIDIRLNAAHPELPLVEATTFTGAPSSVFIRGVPRAVGNWSITAVNVAVTYPDNTTTTRAAVESAEGVWVATIPGTATSGRTTSGFRVLADGIDENGAAVTGYVLGFADFSVLSFAPVPAPGGTFWYLRYFDTMPTTPKKGDVAKIDGLYCVYNGTAWDSFGDGPGFSEADPLMDGSAAPGSATTAARSDHVHPTDTSRASTSDATLTDAFTAWNVSSNVTNPITGEYLSEWQSMTGAENGVVTVGSNRCIYIGGKIASAEQPTSQDGLSVVFESNGWANLSLALGVSEGNTIAMRTKSGYQLGTQTTKPLASEAEAEALRTGKLNKTAVVAPSTSSSDAGKAADAKATGDALALIAPAWVQTSAYSAYDCVKYNGAYYYAKTDIAANTAWNANNWGSLANLSALAHQFLPLTGGMVRGEFRVAGSYYENFQVVPEQDNGGSYISPTMRFGDGAGVVGIIWRLVDGGVVMDVSDILGTTYRIALPSASGILSLAAGAGHAGNLAALDANGNPTDSGIKPSDKLDSTSAAPAFSSDSSTQYAVGSHCTYNGKLYVCTTATTGGTWVAASWELDTMTDPDAVLDITSQNQLRVVAKDGTLLWAQGYDLASTSSATLACDACNNFTFADGATSQAFALPTAPTGKVGDFGLDIDNSANTSAATLTLTGLDTAFSIVVPKGESLNDMLSIAAGELARFYITLSTFRVNNLPTWHITKQIVENGGATV